ncbi:hypothetical protein N7540_006234 [Penicillium herquei]|nr:hypothetical protein N7540_006234 [Penicillium herquei]
MSWGPKNRPPGFPKRPTVVFETAISETWTRLFRDVEKWLDPNHGYAKVVITAKLDRKKPQITIERWEWSQNSGQVTKMQTIEITESSGLLHVTGAPLVIPFDLLFLRAANTTGTQWEGDITIGRESLKTLAQTVWEIEHAAF